MGLLGPSNSHRALFRLPLHVLLSSKTPSRYSLGSSYTKPRLRWHCTVHAQHSSDTFGDCLRSVYPSFGSEGLCIASRRLHMSNRLRPLGNLCRTRRGHHSKAYIHQQQRPNDDSAVYCGYDGHNVLLRHEYNISNGIASPQPLPNTLS